MGSVLLIPRPYALSIVRLHHEASQAISQLPIGHNFFLALRARNYCGCPGWTIPRPDLPVPHYHTHISVRSSYASICGMNVVQNFIFPLKEYKRLYHLFEISQICLSKLPGGTALTFAIFGIFRTSEDQTVYTTFMIHTTPASP